MNKICGEVEARASPKEENIDLETTPCPVKILSTLTSTTCEQVLGQSMTPVAVLFLVVWCSQHCLRTAGSGSLAAVQQAVFWRAGLFTRRGQAVAAQFGLRAHAFAGISPRTAAPMDGSGRNREEGDHPLLLDKVAAARRRRTVSTARPDLKLHRRPAAVLKTRRLSNGDRRPAAETLITRTLVSF